MAFISCYTQFTVCVCVCVFAKNTEIVCVCVLMFRSSVCCGLRFELTS